MNGVQAEMRLQLENPDAPRSPWYDARGAVIPEIPVMERVQGLAGTGAAEVKSALAHKGAGDVRAYSGAAG